MRYGEVKEQGRKIFHVIHRWGGTEELLCCVRLTSLHTPDICCGWCGVVRHCCNRFKSLQCASCVSHCELSDTQAANITMRDVSAVVNYYQDKALGTL